jgi:outer membrane immunogenic protein
VLGFPGLNATEWGQQMKKLLLASTAVGALAMAGPALAADIPVKAPPVVAPVPVFTWTGCFIGGHGGFAGAQKQYDLTGNEIVVNGGPAFIGHIVGDGTFFLPTGFTSFSHDPFGGFGGGQVGCQYQWDKWVIGIEGSFSGANISGDSGGINLPFRDPVSGALATDKFVSFKSRTDWFASVAAKFGYTGGRWLVYSKVGVAWEHTKFFGNGFVVDNDAPAPFPTFLCTAANCTFNMSASDTPTGWTTGVGIEFAALPWLTIFLEYDHYDFGRKTLNFSGAFVEGVALHTFTGVPLRNKEQIDTIRLGFNFLFNWGKAPTPVVARY